MIVWHTTKRPLAESGTKLTDRMKVTINIEDSNYLLARVKLVRQEEDDKSKRAVVVAAEKARDATTYIGNQLSNSQQVRLAMVAIEKVFNELNYKENESK